MFAPKKLIELHGVDYRRLPPKELADLLDVLQLLPEHEECVLVLYTVGEEFDAGQPPRRASALYKKLEELVTPLCFEYESESDLCSWVLRHLQASGISASPGDARKIVEFCSKDMFNLSNEVEKLICYTLRLYRRPAARAERKGLQTACRDEGKKRKTGKYSRRSGGYSFGNVYR